ncbi:MAG: DUF6088 family protein, partial [Lentisphaerales bacterium]|nr:DUF6088 family protein [Lentisphaerales bacterium]
VYGKGRLWSFSKIDFVDFGEAASVEKALSRLCEKGTIRRVMRGVYDYPKFSKLLNKELAPDIDQIAHALARKFGWEIQVTGNAALNLIGLSTQVPGRYVYLCNGKSRSYEIGNRVLEFKKQRLRDMGFKYNDSALLVQALITLNKKELDEEESKIIRSYFDVKTQSRILKDTQYATSWVYDLIKKIFKDQK